MSESVDIGREVSDQEPLHGHAVVRITGVPLAPAGIARNRINRGIMVRAPGPSDDGGGNTAIVFVGGSAVTADNAPGTGGVPLPPGASITIPCGDPNKIYVVTAAGTPQDVAWMAV
jgi:hypothetical protein